MNCCRRCRVSGRVQGVFYRASTRQQAERLGVTGWARNLPDGSVEVLACGREQDVEALCQWLWQGPRLAEVADVRCEAAEYQSLSGFATR
jgi:acylphosphatase